ncbi:uncharacterized protein K460DRAFT_375557 [Cucurbitaria berberidis CBS 394.84]|uniref:Protein kinase domain-containing protein n=1 Tax=Cucurbitaria berberidis CBS 394.84 TaxID=1168544 RepID=A0A9P4GP55_9PLEO|nr:uncharacterized protein K460DRAFT_375557 [Cucurbitaria berberidis CBS 394.84]KAF1848772.1 hypothetical protein K460DRAFT_375557 [Cucurbitaria berberidis CBS 394.84]
MAVPDRLAYVQLDDYDRHVFDHVLSDDTERYAFIRFFQHVSVNYQRQKRPRSGRGRVRLWNKTHSYWVRKAQEQQELPAIQRSAPVVPAVAPPLPAPILTVQVPSAVEIAPVPSPVPASIPTAPVPSSANTIPVASRSPSPVLSSQNIPPTSGSKRARNNDEEPSVASLEPPAKRRRPVIGGERCPPFVLHNGLHETEPGVSTYFEFPPTLQQREFVQKTLGGTWRYAKTLHQSPINSVLPKPRSGIPPRSIDLFVKLDEAGIIQDRVAVKYTDISWDKDTTTKKRVELEEAVVHTIPDGCRHLPAYRNIVDHTMNFTIDGGYSDNKDPSCWKQRYIFSDYAPHGDLYQLINNHARASKVVPEHFIWYVFKQLVDALTTLETGVCKEMDSGPTTGQEDRWQPILHLDIKSGNVLLASPDPTYKSYRQPVLTDFDCSTRLSNNPIKRKEQMKNARGYGTRCWQAPEHAYEHVHTKHYTPSTWDLNHRTDIYALGLLIRHLMLCATMPSNQIAKLHRDETSFFPTEATSRNEAPEQEVPWRMYPEVYSIALIRTVHRCLAFRQYRDPAKPNKGSRPSLSELQGRINHHLSQLDQMCGDGVTAAHYPVDHPLHVMFPEDDPRFTIGTLFSPEPTATVKELILSSATDLDKARAHDTFTTYAPSAPNALAIPRAEDTHSDVPQPTMKVQEDVLKEVITEVRRDALKGPQSVERDLRAYAIDHADTTIHKCVNPHGNFKQLKGAKDSKFFSPESKHATLTSMKSWADKLLDDTKTAIEQEQERMAWIDDDVIMDQAEDIDAVQENESVQEEKARVRALRTQELRDKKQLIQEHEAYLQQKLIALKDLSEAVDIGMAVLVLGDELELDAELADEHWMTKVSGLHRGVWEYFWSRPSGVFT